MSMNRRELVMSSFGGFGVLGAGEALAVGVEGRDFRELKRSATTPVMQAGKKVQLVEFFWYGCNHCAAFEGPLTSWLKGLPKDVEFRRVPVAFGKRQVIHQRLFYAIEKSKRFEELHQAVFHAIHVEGNALEDEAAVLAWSAGRGISAAEMKAALNAMSVETSVRQAALVADAYGVTSVPSFGVQGRYVTSPSMTGSAERTFGVATALMGKARMA